MMNNKMKIIIRKDIKLLIQNKRFISMLLIVPFVFVVVLPSVFILSLKFLPIESVNIDGLMALLPQFSDEKDIINALLDLVMNSMLPMFFLLIPIISASVMAASSFVGEKEKHTLETLFYSPLSISQIFQAKVLASLWMSYVIAMISFIFMVVFVNLELFVIDRTFFVPSVSWLLIIFLLVPAVTLLAITFIVKTSAKSQSMEEAQQKAGALVIPIMFLAVSQFSGLFVIGPLFIGIFGAILLGLALLLLKHSARTYTYEKMML